MENGIENKNLKRKTPVKQNNDVGFERRNIARRGLELLKKYKDGKASLEQRIISDELFWRQRYNDYAASKNSTDPEKNKRTDVPRPTSAWLFNSVVNKHADLMDNYPSAVCLPRERSDEASADALSSIIPVIMERSGFEKVYSDNAYYKIKHGACAYGVFWDSSLENGLGDIIIKSVDLLNLYWEPGIKELEESKNVFCVTLRDREELTEEYPGVDIKSGDLIDVAKYILDDNIDTSDKVLVVDWYYKKRIDGRTVVHFMKLAGEEILYSTEDDAELSDRGLYDHGKYPFILDVLYPESGTPYGFGVIAVTKDAQVYIDRLDQNILEHTLMQSKPRFFIKKTANINQEEFLDWNIPIVTVDGSLNDDNYRPITVPGLNGIVVNVRDAKINEMKETSANRDVNSGGTSGGVTSGAAIATLQEAGNKVSRDIINTTYRSYVEIVRLVIELMRQFYTETRTFRVTGDAPGKAEYVDFSSAQIAEQAFTAGEEELYRVPIFDIDVRAEKRSPYARLSQNETVMNLYKLGFFNPENAQSASVALEALEFEGKDKMLDKIKEGDTLMKMCSELQKQVASLASRVSALSGQGQGVGANGMSKTASSTDMQSSENVSTGSMADRNAMHAQSYADDLVRRGVQS